MRTILSIAMLTLLAVSTPKIIGIEPQQIAVSATPQRIVITGTDFQNGLTLAVTAPDGTIRRLTDVEVVRGRMTTIPVSLAFNAAGPYELVVTNPDGGRSDPFRIDVGRAADPPVIEQVLPAQISRSPSPQQITLRGRGFEPGMRLSLTDPTGTVTVTDVFDRLDRTVAVVRLLLPISGTYGLMVTNPSGAASNTVGFTIR